MSRPDTIADIRGRSTMGSASDVNRSPVIGHARSPGQRADWPHCAPSMTRADAVSRGSVSVSQLGGRHIRLERRAVGIASPCPLFTNTPLFGTRDRCAGRRELCERKDRERPCVNREPSCLPGHRAVSGRRQLVAIRVDAGVLDRFRKESRRRHVLPNAHQRGARPATPARTSRWGIHGEVAAPARGSSLLGTQ